MDLGKISEKLFVEEFMEANKDKLPEIFSMVESWNEFNLEVTGMNLDDIVKKSKDPSYKIDNEIKIEGNTIKMKYPFESFVSELKKHINKNVIKLSVPSEIYGDLEYMRGFTKASSLTITDHSRLDENELNFFNDNTNIRNINFKSRYYSEEYPELYKLSAKHTPHIYRYKDLKLSDGETPEELTDVVVSGNSFNMNKIMELYQEYNSVKEFSIRLYNKDECKISFDENGNVQIDLKGHNPTDLVEISKYFIDKNININGMTFALSYDINKSFNCYEIDYDELDKLSEKINIEVVSSPFEKSSYSSFKTMVDGIRWYKNIIKDANLSPAEKVTMAYDIMKTFQYTEVEEHEDKNISRNPQKIMNTGKIVCVGYSKMMEEILSSIDPNIKIGDFSVTCHFPNGRQDEYHARNVVRIDDDKYNIHGMYVIDATWDSIKRNGQDVLDKDYDALSLYHYFLIPLSKYHEVFKNDSLPRFFDGKYSTLNDTVNDELISKASSELQEKENQPIEENNKIKTITSEKPFSYNIKELKKPSEKDSEFMSSFIVRDIPFEEKLSIIRNVRLAEGYTPEMLDDEIEKVRRVNTKFDEIKSGKTL